MEKKSLVISVLFSLLFLVFFLFSETVPMLISLVLTIIIFIVSYFALDIFYEKEKEEFKSARLKQKEILEKAFRKGQVGGAKGYGFSEENKKWVLKK